MTTKRTTHSAGLPLGQGVAMTVLAVFLGSCTPGSHSGPSYAQRQGVHLPDRIQDPLEPFNRGIWAFNEGLLEGVIAPAGKGYRLLVPTPARTSIHNFGYNLGYPGRALNQVLQGRMGDAGDESLRFVTNSTAGVLGLFDVASKWEIPKPRGNFAQTFQTWGWKGQNFVVIPVLGPSDEAGLAGSVADRLADPLSYHKDARHVLLGVRFNNLAEDADETLRLLQSDPDSYSLTKYIWTYVASEEAPDWSLHGPVDTPTLETLAVATLRFKDPRFLGQLREAKVEIPTTGRELPFSYRLQKEPAPLVYVLPGLGSHRLTMQALSLAEGLYARGYSVVAISSPFHPEFLERASRCQLPGFASGDRSDLWTAFDAIDAWLSKSYGNRIEDRSLVGCSLGGFHALAMASESETRPRPRCTCGRGCHKAVQFQKFVAVNPPVDLLYGMKLLDSYQEAPGNWPASDRQQRINNVVHKAVALMARPKDPGLKQPPFDGIESKYIVGLAFRLSLRNAIYACERLHQLGNLERKLSWWNREEVYEEILTYSFEDYVEKMLLPHLDQRGVTRDRFVRECDLKRLGAQLGNSGKAEVITSRNDFLLSDQDLAWLQGTFTDGRLNLLPKGGHLGGLADPAFIELIASRLGSPAER